MDYWRNPTIGYGSGGNNHEAGASVWYSRQTIGRKLYSPMLATTAMWVGHSYSTALLCSRTCPAVFNEQATIENLHAFVGQECPTHTSL
jgi:hypothetical protein